jgi:hypothetical protein
MASNSKKVVRRTTTETNVENVVYNGVVSVVKSVRKGNAWTGTMTDLNSALITVLGRKNSNILPGSPSALRVVLNRVISRLRNNKVSVKFGRTTDHSRTRYVKFSR